MIAMDPELAYRAVVAFLEDQWNRHPVPGDFGSFWGDCRYIPGKGTRDPALWYDWLAWVKKLQTGELVPESRGWLKAEMLQSLDPEQAYLAMFAFIEEYWLRVSRPTDIGDLLGRMRYTPSTGTADPEMWKRWLAAVEKVQADR